MSWQMTDRRRVAYQLNGLTWRQESARRVLAVLPQHRADPFGRSVRALAAESGLATRTVVVALRTLELEYGYVERIGPFRIRARLTDTAL